ncbi:aminodeoxychorismate lyase [Allosaccharopolyspora coralli]|uniref:Aminodeoxychorismate lyase n=1 Tax=Allosaccharopolyspora coralli TaxID=2665642 RepID=A0A5Q3QEF7_9PSEU|nr:aminodeoxychorismate lyase [Allosaccharopolyspora coralli]QGK71756.1 aminodeoxychorismate lyase [Allosaccharopolyspora coralli]
MRVLALLDGTLADPDAPQLRVDDLGVHRGDGIFETILVVEGRPRELGPHLDRLERSARLMDMTIPPREDWQRLVAAAVDAWPWKDDREMALKIVCTRGVEGTDVPTAWGLGTSIEEQTKRKRADGVSVVTLERGIAPELMERAPWLLLSAKTLSYAVNMAAMREARRRDADEVVFVASDGTVLEGPTSNVVLAQGNSLLTTPPSTGILRGTTQGALFRAAENAGWNTRVERFGVDDMLAADGVWLASSVRLVTQVRSIDGAEVKADPALHETLGALYESNYS